VLLTAVAITVAFFAVALAILALGNARIARTAATQPAT
jgi:hypothetical protein